MKERFRRSQNPLSRRASTHSCLASNGGSSGLSLPCPSLSPERKGGVLTGIAFFLVASALLTGCGKGKKDDTGKKGKDKPDLVKDVDFGAGDTTVFASTDPKAPISFTVVWQRGGLNAVQGNVETGHLNDVTGDLFSNGKKSSNYRADRGDAIREKKRLTLSGNVVLKSSDGSQTMHAPQAEYHGDLGFVRAIGGVTAEGSFGTLSGVPELWATPDLSLIGTPDMVSKTLKIPALIALAAAAAPAKPIVQKGRDYDVEAGSWQIQAIKGTKDSLCTVLPDKGGTVTVKAISRNMVFHSAGKMVFTIDGTTNEVKKLTAEGAADVVQTKPGKKVTLTGTGVQYDLAPGGLTGNIKLGGRVTATSVSDDKDSSGKVLTRTVVSKGDQGSAVLYSKPATGVDPIKSMTLVGNVTVDVKGSSGHYTALGDKIVYTPNGTNARAVMTGALTLGGESAVYQGTVENADMATVDLDNEGWQNITLTNSKGGKIHSTGDKNAPPAGGGR